MLDAKLLQQQIAAAQAAKGQLLLKLEGDYDPSLLESFSGIQAQIKNLTTQLDATQIQGNSEAGLCQVSLLRGGKSDQSYEIRADASLADLLTHVGWGEDSLTFRKRVAVGQSVEIMDPGTHIFGPGEHEIFVAHKAANG